MQGGDTEVGSASGGMAVEPGDGPTQGSNKGMPQVPGTESQSRLAMLQYSLWSPPR